MLAPDDPRQINVDSMEAEARNWLAQEQPGFISSGGRLLGGPASGSMGATPATAVCRKISMSEGG